MAARRSTVRRPKNEPKSDPAVSYAGSDKWSATPKTQRKHMITFLRSVIADLERQNDDASDVISPRRRRAAPTRRSGARYSHRKLRASSVLPAPR
jgi:hypothetical protein